MKHTTLILLTLLSCVTLSAQIIPDSARRIVLEPGREAITSEPNLRPEDAPLDHDRARGFTIVGHDRDIQLQLQASVRDLSVLDFYNLSDRQSFTTWDIPTGSTHKLDPSFYNDLRQTRLALIGQRVTDIGTITLRVETDFAGPNGFRIRHAYGEFEDLLIGQTWSLFSHVTLQPLTIDLNGPLGIARNLNPQVRYRWRNVWSQTDVTVGVEFPRHTYRPTEAASPVEQQLMPDPSVRVTQRFTWGEIQSSLIIPFLSGRYGATDALAVSVGWGVASSAQIEVSSVGTVRLHAAVGQGIADFFSTFAGQGYNASVNQLDEPELNLTLGGYASYQHWWSEVMSSTVTASVVNIGEIQWDGTSTDAFNLGWTTAANTFWHIYDGLHAGAEATLGGRSNYDESWGTVVRVSGLIYYEL